jgi:hypothetical protein
MEKRCRREATEKGERIEKDLAVSLSKEQKCVVALPASLALFALVALFTGQRLLCSSVVQY